MNQRSVALLVPMAFQSTKDLSLIAVKDSFGSFEI